MLDLLGTGKFNYFNYTGYWAGNDSEERYRRNLKTRYDEMKTHGWLDSETAVTYSFNQWGFRSKEFDSTGGIMFLGCSHVVGVGLAETDTFSHIVSERLGLELYRMGIGAGSNDSSFRVADYWIPKLKPKCVVMIQTYSTRVEMLTDTRTQNITANDSDQYSNSVYYKKFIYSAYNTDLLKKKNRYGIEHLCNIHNSKFVWLDAEQEPFKLAEQCDFARDLAHIGKKGNQYLANVITDMVELN